MHWTRHTAVLTLHSVILRSRLPSKCSMNHLAPCCSIRGGFFAGAAAATLGGRRALECHAMECY